MSAPETADLEQRLISLQKEVDDLRKRNTDLDERLKAHSLINSGQISLINKLIDKVPFGVMLLDEQHLIIHANAAACTILSSSISDMKGQHRNHYFESYKEPEKWADKALELQQVINIKNNKCVLHSAFVSDEGSDKIIVESFIDITEIKNAEKELLKTNRTKDEFLGMISHELRTPLNIIQGYSSLLEEELGADTTEDASSYIKKINGAGETLLRLVNNLLELSDLTAGKIKADYIPIDLNMILTQLQYRLEEDVKSSRNTFSFTTENIEPFNQDLALLMRALYELLVNANKFTESGEIQLAVSLQKKDNVDWLCFKVLDTGCGMTEETIELIFNAFHQVDSSLTRSYEGLGLGLSLVEKIVTIINGYIEVKSELGKGSVFSIYLPYERTNN